MGSPKKTGIYDSVGNSLFGRPKSDSDEVDGAFIVWSGLDFWEGSINVEICMQVFLTDIF